MLLIEGPNAQLRSVILEQLRRDTNPGTLTFTHGSEVFTNRNLNYYIRLLHTDHHTQVFERLRLTGSLETPERYMVAMGLKARGTISVVCQANNTVETMISTAGGILPYINCTFADDPALVVEKVMDYWQYHINTSFPVADYHSIGGVFRNQTMIVSDVRKSGQYAFVGAQNSTLLLHKILEEISNELDNPHLFYLTSTVKTGNNRTNTKMLKDEIEMVKPARIVAMGSSAAAMLSSIHATFERTDHPQYWARFRSHEYDLLKKQLTNGTT